MSRDTFTADQQLTNDATNILYFAFFHEFPATFVWQGTAPLRITLREMFVSEGTWTEAQTERVRRAGEGCGIFIDVWVLVGGEMETFLGRTKLSVPWTHRTVLFTDIIFLSRILLWDVEFFSFSFDTLNFFRFQNLTVRVWIDRFYTPQRHS